MQEDYNYIEQMIELADNDFKLDCCKTCTELFHLRWRGVSDHAELYQNLLGFVLAKYQPIIEA